MFNRIFKTIISRLPQTAKKALYFFLQNNFTQLDQPLLNRYNTVAILQLLKGKGFAPGVVIDIGAFEGIWSREMSCVFPCATYHLFEPQAEKEEIIRKNLANINYQLHPVLLGDLEKASVPFHVMETGSSLKEELSFHKRQTIALPMTTLDTRLFAGTTGNCLLKIDVQGAELEVLAGAKNMLERCEVVVMELSFLNYNAGAPLAHEVIAKMNELGFVIFDFGGFLRNANDKSLIQADVIFLRESSSLRRQFNDFSKPYTVFAS